MERKRRDSKKSVKADVLFRMLLVKQHSKIGICFTSALDKEICLNAVAYQQPQRVPTSFSLTGFLSQIKL